MIIQFNYPKSVLEPRCPNVIIKFQGILTCKLLQYSEFAISASLKHAKMYHINEHDMSENRLAQCFEHVLG